MRGLCVFLHHVEQAAREQGWPLEEALAWIRDLGISMVEVDGDATADAGALRAALDRAGLGVSSVYAKLDWMQGVRVEKGLRLLDTAEALGAPLVMPIPDLYSPSALSGGPLREAADALLVENARRLAEEAARRGLTVTLEDYDNAASPIRDIRGLRMFLEAIPALTVTLDTGNFRFCGEDVLEAQRLFRGRISHAHLKDRRLSRDENAPEDSALLALSGERLWPCAVGDGVIPLEEVLRRLADEHYTGALTLEHFGVQRWKRTIEKSAAAVLRLVSAFPALLQGLRT